MSRLFPVNIGDSMKTVDWDAIVHAMGDVGFLARHSSGSAVVFEKETPITAEDKNGRIVFHKPHPVAKLNPLMLHWMEKWMGKWFGWLRDSFIVESKSVSAT